MSLLLNGATGGPSGRRKDFPSPLELKDEQFHFRKGHGLLCSSRLHSAGSALKEGMVAKLRLVSSAKETQRNGAKQWWGQRTVCNLCVGPEMPS